MLYVAVKDGQGDRTLAFPGDAIIIGSAPAADLVLDGPGVAPEHARVVVRDGAILVIDVRARKTTGVAEGEAIELAGATLRFALDDTAAFSLSDPVEQRLLDAVTANPGDAATRSVYADWLESNGGSAHAEFLRTQLELADARDANDKAFQAAARRLAKLAARLEPGWRARVAIAFVEGCASTHASVPPRVEPRLAMELVCPQRWDRLAPTPLATVRHCDACRRDVHYCTTIEQARGVASRGGCVAVDVRNAPSRRAGDLAPPRPMMGMPAPPPPPPPTGKPRG